MLPSAPVTEVTPALAGFGPVPRCTITLRHYRCRTEPYAPTAQAVTGALDIYAEGRRERDVLRMLFGLSILRSATAEQVDTAMGVRTGTGQGTSFATSPAETNGPTPRPGTDS